MTTKNRHDSVDLSIIIVDYKASVEAKNLARKLEHPNWESIIVDNNITNRGYGGGLNFGASKAKGKFFLFLNPDVEIEKGEVEKLISYLNTQQDVAAVGPAFFDVKGQLVPSCVGELTWLGAFIGLSFLHRIIPNQFSKAFWLEGWDRKSTRKVATINGACLLVRQSDFETIGGFDESFFLYWEENDLCDRLRQLGKEVVYLYEARALHRRALSMKRSRLDTSAIFRKSRSLYLCKHFGKLAGSVLIVWLSLVEEWRAILLLVIALIPRIESFTQFPIIDDVRRDYAQALLFNAGKTFPLLGIPSSVPRFSQGPLNIWFDALAFRVGGVSTASPALAAGLVTASVVAIFYFFLRGKVGRNLAFFAGLMIALSPSAITQSRMPFYLFAIPGFTLLFLWNVIRLGKYKFKKQNSLQAKTLIFLSILTFCLLFQWELATIPFVAVLLVALYRNRIRIITNLKPIILAILIGLSPQLLFDLTHRCQQLCNFVVWMGYRTVDVTGLDGRHGFVLFSLDFWQRVAVQLEQVIGLNLMGLLSVFFVIIVGLVYRIRTRNIPTLYFYSLLSTLCLFLGLVVHGDPSEAYFPPFLILLPILLAYSCSIGIRHEK